MHNVRDYTSNDTDELVVRKADLSRAQPPRWAWDKRILVGYLNLLLGNEGIGKGALVAYLIGKWTHGLLPGDFHHKPIGVGVMGDEDSFDNVWVPRLHAADADLGRVALIERPDGGYVDVGRDRQRLEREIRDHEIGLLYFDQLLDNLGAGVDDWRQKPVRDALRPFRLLAREMEIATLGALHPNKRARTFRELVAGAPAFNSVSRSSLLLAQHPDDESRRVLCRGKGNMSETPAAVEFEIAECRFSANGHDFKVPLAQDFGLDYELTAEDLLGRERSNANEHTKVAKAAEIIEQLLPRDGDWHPTDPIYQACECYEINERTIKRAKAALNVEHRRTETFPAHTEWRWPGRNGRQ